MGQNKKRVRESLQPTKQSWYQVTWGKLEGNIAVAGLLGVGALGIYGLSYSRAPDVKRPIYNSRDECLADWASTPQDCEPEESRTASSAGIYRQWYGPWIDNRGTVYHKNGSHSMRPSYMVNSKGYSETSRLGFGASNGLRQRGG
jgi:hypothetical protein